MKHTLLLFLVIAMLLPAVSYAIDYEEELQKLAKENGKGYIGPFSTAFGTGMNSGLYHTAKTHGWMPPGFDITMRMAVVTVPDEYKTFDFYVGSIPVSGDNFGMPDQDLMINLEDVYPDREVPTVFGEDQAGTIAPANDGAETALRNALLAEGKTQQEIDQIEGTAAWNNAITEINQNAPVFETPQGIGFDMLPVPIGQVSVGLPMESEVMLRLVPETDLGDAGSLSLLGLGIKHNLDQYIPIPMFPVSISGQFVWQKLELGDILTSTHMAANVHASKTFGLGLTVTPYIGLGWESSNLEINYTLDQPGNPYHGQDISFDLEGDNQFRATVGASFKIFLININADYSIGEFYAYTLGASITFR